MDSLRVLGSVARIALLLAVAYVALGVVVVLARDRLVFPVRGGSSGDPKRLGIADGKRLTIHTADGVGLAAWWLPPRGGPGPQGAVLWFHGNGERLDAIGPILREFRPAAAGLLAIDYRGYGESTGRTTIAGTLRDAEAAWGWLAARPEVDSARIVIYGRSVGSGPACHLAGERAAAGLILESAFTSLRAMARRQFPFFPPAFAGSLFDNLDAVGRSRAPLLIIVGDADRTIPPAMGRALAARAGDRAEVWTIPGADHNDTYGTGGDEYVRRFRAFVARVTAAPSS